MSDSGRMEAEWDRETLIYTNADRTVRLTLERHVSVEWAEAFRKAHDWLPGKPQ